MEFDLDDIKDLAITGSKRSSIINNYDLDSLKKMREINCREIQNLRETIEKDVEYIIDEKTRSRILTWMKSINKALEKNIEFNPEEYFIKNDASRFSQQCMNICSFDGITTFLSNVFMNYKHWERKGNSDARALYKIFDNTKKSCKSLGIFSADERTLYEAYMDPESDRTYNIGIRYQINFEKEEYMEKDITIREIPYIIRFPSFRPNGEIIEYLTLPVNEAVCYYNLDKYDELVEQAKQRQQ